MSKPIHLARKGGKLVVIAAQGGDEKEMGFLITKCAQEFCFSHPPAPVEDIELGVVGGVQLVQLFQLNFAVDEYRDLKFDTSDLSLQITIIIIVICKKDGSLGVAMIEPVRCK